METEGTMNDSRIADKGEFIFSRDTLSTVFVEFTFVKGGRILLRVLSEITFRFCFY